MTPPAPTNKEQFIGEALRPDSESFDPRAMAGGEPGLPDAVTWRGNTYRIVAVAEKWKTTSGCSHGSGEQYVRRHWYKVRTDPDLAMTLYCDRQATRGRRKAPRWWLYTISLATPTT